MDNTAYKRMLDEEYVPFAVELQISDFERSLAFYRDVLSFKLIRVYKEERFASFSFNGSILMIKETPNLPASCGNCVAIRFIIQNDLQSYHDLITSRGAKISKPIEEMHYGLKRFYVSDPDGHQLKFASK